MNVPIASAQDHGGSPKLCNIAQVPLVVTLFGEGEYSTDEMIWMPCLSQSSFICLATSSFTLLNITILTISFCIRLTHFPNLIGVFNFTLNRPFSWSGNHTFLLHPNQFPLVSSHCLWYVVLVMFYLCGIGKAAGGGCTTFTHNLDSPLLDLMVLPSTGVMGASPS